VLTDDSVVARQWQGVAEDLEGAMVKVPGKEKRVGAHQNGGSTVRRHIRRRAAGLLRWSSTCVEGSCSTGVEGGREI
jgi:hypothetical protein